MKKEKENNKRLEEIKIPIKIRKGSTLGQVKLDTCS